MLKIIKDKIDKNLILRFIKFGIVGTSGIAVNTGILYILKDVFGVSLIIAPVFAIGTAVFSNFMLNNYWTWNKNKQIRKMFGNIGYRVQSLRRTRINKLKLGILSVGKWKYVSIDKII